MPITNRQWRRGKKAALIFYRSKLSWKNRQFNHAFPLAPYFDEMIGNKRDVMIADLGAGMFSTTGSTHHSATVHLYPSDMLADEFNKMIKDHKDNIIPVIPVEKEDMLALTYLDDLFDIVHCANALDHCLDPLKAIKEMYRVCKPGGWIYLRHFENVAQYEGHKGMHQWNLCKEGDSCKIWNDENSFLLSVYFKNETVTEVDKDKRPDTIVITKIQKI